jgi:hypothetical protein
MLAEGNLVIVINSCGKVSKPLKIKQLSRCSVEI